MCRPSTIGLILMAAKRKSRAYRRVGLFLIIKGRYVSDLDGVLFRNSDRLIANRMRWHVRDVVFSDKDVVLNSL
jgi:hypothetical protein